MVQPVYGLDDVIGAFLSALDDLDSDIKFNDEDGVRDAWEALLPRLIVKLCLAFFSTDELGMKCNRQFAKDFVERYNYPITPRKWAIAFCDQLGYGNRTGRLLEKDLDYPFLIGLSVS